MKVLCTHPATGTAAIRFGSTGRRLWYRCDPITHHVVVTDDRGRTVRAFGGYGRAPGRFDTPLDVTFVHPQFAGEHLPTDSADAVWIAVADYGNRRVQVFELDGAVVGEVAPDGDEGTPWPPAGLTWNAPVLEIEGVEGARTRVHLSGALLAGTTARALHGDRRTATAAEARH
jgi:hypothetical protein